MNHGERPVAPAGPVPDGFVEIERIERTQSTRDARPVERTVRLWRCEECGQYEKPLRATGYTPAICEVLDGQRVAALSGAHPQSAAHIEGLSRNALARRGVTALAACGFDQRAGVVISRHAYAADVRSRGGFPGWHVAMTAEDLEDLAERCADVAHVPYARETREQVTRAAAALRLCASQSLAWHLPLEQTGQADAKAREALQELVRDLFGQGAWRR
jgi:hypothetical protein